MNIESKLSGHWTDDQLIEYLYGVGPEDGHLDICAHCRTRAIDMRDRQAATHSLEQASDGVSKDLLAAQRRQIYAKLSRPIAWWGRVPFTRWASIGAAALALGAGAIYYGERQQQQAFDSMLSDAQLAQDVSRMSENPEAQPTAPLQALFEE